MEGLGRWRSLGDGGDGGAWEMEELGIILCSVTPLPRSPVTPLPRSPVTPLLHYPIALTLRIITDARPLLAPA
jgi:hypothetical protein